MKVALGMIVRNLSAKSQLMSFIENAEKYGHKLDCVIVVYAQRDNTQVEEKIREKTTLYTVDINNPEFCKTQIKKLGIPAIPAQTLIKCPIVTTNGIVPYGHNRMMVVMEAILRDVDVLFFIDSDVSPYALMKNPDGSPEMEELDFFGTHLEHLQSDCDVTTGEYSGYNILPPAAFEGMDDFLSGVQKDDVREFWQNSNKHKCLIYRPNHAEAKPCAKILGGNLAIKLSAFSELPPFFSSHYTVGDELFLCRGEDTVLGFELSTRGKMCKDIGLYPMHDTYDSYPSEPDLQNDELVQRRFYYACTGWVGRNPFYNYILGNDLQSIREFQREHLERGLDALAKYTSNPAFISVLRNFDVSWNNLDRYVSEFQSVSEAWEIFKKKTIG